MKLLTKRIIAAGRDGLGALNGSGGSDLELGDKASGDAGTSPAAGVVDGDDDDDDEEGARRNVSVYELASIFRPYFWPHSTANKLIAISTYTVMTFSKIAGVMAPAYVSLERH